MAVRIRLKRLGRKNRPYYRICVFNQRTRRDGTPIEELGSYDPYIEDQARKVELKRERALYWLNVGAQPSETVASMLRKAGVRKGEPLTEIAAPEAVAGDELASAGEPVAVPDPTPPADPATSEGEADASAAGAVPSPPEES